MRFPLSCSFCGKDRLKVKTLIAGPLVNICNECVEVCVDILAEHNAKKAAPQTCENTNCKESEEGKP